MAIATTSVLAVIERNDTFLFVRETKSHVVGRFALPGGGIDQDESPEQAAIREVEEETGFQVRVERLLGVYYRYKKDKGQQNVIFAFACSVQGGAIRVSEAHPEVKWCSPEEIAEFSKSGQLRTPHIVDILNRYKSGADFDRSLVATVFD